MAVTVDAILAVLGGFGANRGSGVPILSSAAVPRASAPLTLVDNPQEEARMRQRVARRSDEVTRLLALPHGPVFALGNDATDAVEAGRALLVPPSIRSIVERPSTPDLQIVPQISAPAPRETERRVAALAEGPKSAIASAPPAVPAALAPCDGPLTPIAPEAYFSALRAAAARPNTQMAAAPSAAVTDTASDALPPRPMAKDELPDAQVAGLVPSQPLSAAVAPPQPRPKPAALTVSVAARQAVKNDRVQAEKARAERAKAEKAKRAQRAAANRKKLLARRARAAAVAAAAAVKPAPVQTDWLGQPVRTGSR